MKTLNQIDYTPLEDFNSSWWTTFAQQMLSLTPILIILICASFGYVIIQYVGYIGIFAISAVPAYVGKKVQNRKNSAWKRFAEVNGWYILPISQDDARYIPPGLFHKFSRPRMSIVIHANFEGHECDIFSYQYEVGNWWSKKRTYYYTIARVLLERPFPHLILDSKKTWAINRRGTASEKVKLEGNFDNYFSLYFNPGSHIDALSIITPDIMQTLIELNKEQDIEVIDNNLFFIMSEDHRYPEKLPKVLASIDALADEFAHKAKTIHVEPEAVMGITALRNAVANMNQSGDAVMNNLSIAFVAIIVLPFAFFLLVSILTFFVP